MSVFPGRNAGFRSIQGLTIKSQCEKLRATAEHQQARFAQSASRNWRTKTLQNLASAIATTIAATVAVKLALNDATTAMRATAVWLAVTAMVGNLVIVTRRHAERSAAHFQIARRYAALAASCRQSLTKYEGNQIDDIALQALFDQHLAEATTLKRETQRT